MEKTKKDLVEMCENEINRATVFIAFYKQQEAKQNKETSAKTKLKRMQLEDTLTVNKEMLEFFKKY